MPFVSDPPFLLAWSQQDNNLFLDLDEIAYVHMYVCIHTYTTLRNADLLKSPDLVQSQPTTV